MASIILSSVGSSVGKAVGGAPGAFLGQRFGQMLGGFADQRLSGGNAKTRAHEGPRLADLAVQSSTYGKMIPIVYGTMRIAGNVIWSLPIQEVGTTTTTSASTGAGGKGGGGGRVSQSNTTYSYYISLAISICEGPIDEVIRIWADAKQLDLSQFTLRLYKGSEEQEADTFIQSFEGEGSTPAYRGQAYVVLENFLLTDYGNRIPNFTFEVKKRVQRPEYGGEILENMIGSMTLIPGAGEFVYDPQVEYKVPGVDVGGNWVQQGSQNSINMHNYKGQANVHLALDQLKETCPNVEWVSVVVSWFGDTMDAGTCIVKPGVEFQNGAITTPDIWEVAGFTRSTARQITLIDGSPQYGGTPDDGSMVRLCTELQSRGFKVLFYPMLFMDVDGKPWRGWLTGSSSNVSSFFTKTNGFNAFITHYANLVKDHIDGFVIGSELVGLTKVTSSPGVYPAVSQLVSLASTVKGIVGSGVKVTYAADWSEYHHTDGGYYNLDPLWASSSIDMIGIDAYFPLTNAPQSGYDVQTIIDGWTSGEGYDWYYSDINRTVQAPLAAPYAWKNIEWFWRNTHHNPGGAATAWVPESKPIWFTEYGFPSVDGASNQPNVFYDSTSVTSGFPYHSKGRVDFRAQRAALTATEHKWQGSDFVERMFIWTWDARPFPYWPDLLEVWSDGGNWPRGHWVQGKLGISNLSAIIADLCERAGLESDDYNASALGDQVEGFVIASQQTIRQTIEQLQQGYFFDVVESDYILKFVSRGGDAAVSIPESYLVPQQNGNARELLSIVRTQEIDLPQRINIVYFNRIANYQPSTQYAERQVTQSREIATLSLPIVFADQIAKTIADVTLFSSWVNRNVFQFQLPMKYLYLEPADVIEIALDGVDYRMRINSIHLIAPGVLHVNAVADETASYDFYTPPGNTPIGTGDIAPVSATDMRLLDIPALPSDISVNGYLRMAATPLAGNWKGAVLFRSDDGGSDYIRVLDITAASVMGIASNALAAHNGNFFDEKHTITVVLLGSGELQSAAELAVLNGANAALAGNEIIQFKTATLLEPGKYALSGLLRGRLGTEWATGTHAAGERFVLLDSRVGRVAMPDNMLQLPRLYKPVSVGSTLTETDSQSFIYTGVCLKPLSPVHIEGVRDGSGNLTINWVRRTRLGGDWKDYVDAPVNETTEAYVVDILDGSNVVRTISTIIPSATYSVADQTADFGSPQSSISVAVYQLSTSVGRGYGAEATI